MKLKILSYNIHKGYDWRNRNYFLRDMKELIRAEQADIVFLQEVVGQNELYRKKGLVDSQFEFLADSVWPHFSYARNALYDHGHHGNLILSKFPIESWENINLSTNALEKRGLLVCKIKLPPLSDQSRYIYACCAHLDLLQRGRSRQYEMIKKKIHSLDLVANAPLVIAGDFNDWNQKAHRVFEEELKMQEAYKVLHGRLARTFPAAFPVLSLDRIYVRDLKVLSSGIVQPPQTRHFSDHVPLACEVELYAK